MRLDSNGQGNWAKQTDSAHKLDTTLDHNTALRLSRTGHKTTPMHAYCFSNIFSPMESINQEKSIFLRSIFPDTGRRVPTRTELRRISTRSTIRQTILRRWFALQVERKEEKSNDNNNNNNSDNCITNDNGREENYLAVVLVNITNRQTVIDRAIEMLRERLNHIQNIV